MLKNYLKTAWAVLMRRKFFTFISLFGISLTLTILIVFTAFFDRVSSPGYPDMKRDRSLYINWIVQKNPKQAGMMKGPGSFYYMNHYVGSMKSPEKVAISSIFRATNTYVKNKKLVINIKYTNDAWWEVLEYQFLEGKPYTAQQISNGDRVAVISEEIRDQYFGDGELAVGKYIDADNIRYRVAGVIKSVSVTSPFIYADMYLPYTVSKGDFRAKSLSGEYTAIVLAKSRRDFPRIQEEYRQVVSKIPPQNKDFTDIKSYADPYLESFTRVFSKDENSGLGFFMTVLSLVVFFLMLLPAINLVNVNVSRIMERSSEIGVRKAFGASSSVLALQFVVENVILTLLGGVLSVILSQLILSAINSSDLIPNTLLSINYRVLLYGFGACIFFGLLSGVYPAWRMSRLEVVDALKAQ